MGAAFREGLAHDVGDLGFMTKPPVRFVSLGGFSRSHW